MADALGIFCNHAALALAKHLIQHDHRNPAATDQLTEYRSRPHRGQLVRISHQHQPAHGQKRVEQMPGHGRVQHTDLVHDHQIGVQRFRQTKGVVFSSGQIQRFMNGAGGQAGALLQPSCRTPSRGAADNFRIRECFAVDIQENSLDGRLASSRAAGDQAER